MRIAKIILLGLVVALSSCATLYQKEGPFTNGYSDMRAGKDIFVVTFRANEFTSPDKVRQYALKRAAHLAKKYGYHYFVVLDETKEGKHLHYPSLRLTIQCFYERPASLAAVYVG